MLLEHIIAYCGYIISELSAEQKEIQELARKFTRDEITPKAAEYDRTMEYPWDIIKKAWALGLVNMNIPKDCGMQIKCCSGSEVKDNCSFCAFTSNPLPSYFFPLLFLSLYLLHISHLYSFPMSFIFLSHSSSIPSPFFFTLRSVKTV
jgi:hypothetical protein